MRAVFATGSAPREPLSVLSVGEVPEGPLEALPSGWARVRVAVAGLNHHDIWTLRGISSRPIAYPAVLGCDAAGWVESYGGSPDGPSEGQPAIGTRVVVHAVVSCGECDGCRRKERCARMALLSEGNLRGTLGERVDVPVANLIPLPSGVSFDAAACLPTAYLTAFHMLFEAGGLRPGQSVLIHGGHGGVAVAARTLAALCGAHVIVTSRTEAHLPSTGGGAELSGGGLLPPADGVVLDGDAVGKIFALTGGRGIDLVVETVGDATWELSLKVVRTGGSIVVSGATTGSNPGAGLNRIFWKEIRVQGVTMGSLAQLETLVQLVAEHRLNPLVAGRFQMEDAAGAFACLLEGRQPGKVLVEVAPGEAGL